MLPLSLSVLPAPAGSPSLRYPGRVRVRWVCCAPVRAAVCGSGATARSARAAHSAQCVGSASSHCTAASACRSASSSSVIRLMSDLPASELGHALVPRVPPVSLAGLPCPLRRVIGQDESLRLRPDEVGDPVVQAPPAPPDQSGPAGRRKEAPCHFCR